MNTTAEIKNKLEEIQSRLINTEEQIKNQRTEQWKSNKNSKNIKRIFKNEASVRDI